MADGIFAGMAEGSSAGMAVPLILSISLIFTASICASCARQGHDYHAPVWVSMALCPWYWDAYLCRREALGWTWCWILFAMMPCGACCMRLADSLGLHSWAALCTRRWQVVVVTNWTVALPHAGVILGLAGRTPWSEFFIKFCNHILFQVLMCAIAACLNPQNPVFPALKRAAHSFLVRLASQIDNGGGES